MKPLRGRIIVDIIPTSHIRPSGIVILDRKEVSAKGKVISVGADSMNAKRKPILAPCKLGDICHYKRFVPMFHGPDEKDMKEGLVTIWFEDLNAYEVYMGSEKHSELHATYDNIIIKCILSDTAIGAIIIPEIAQKAESPSYQGMVVAIGPDYPDESLEVGDTIAYPREEGFKVIIGDTTYLKLKEQWVLAIMEVE